MANNAPVFHLRKIPGGEMASTYMESFERVWDGGTPYERPAVVGRRIDFYDDPAAPEANSLVPAVNCRGGQRRRGRLADPAVRQRQLGGAGRGDRPGRVDDAGGGPGDAGGDRDRLPRSPGWSASTPIRST